MSERDKAYNELRDIVSGRDYSNAAAVCERLLGLSEHKYDVYLARYAMGRARLQEGDAEGARGFLAEALTICRELDGMVPFGEEYLSFALGVMYAKMGERQMAIEALGRASSKEIDLKKEGEGLGIDELVKEII